MSAGSPRVERARLFVALELPVNVRAVLVQWRERVSEDVPGLRAVAPEALHVTLCFLGWLELDEIGPVAAACATVAGAGGALLALSRGLWLPRRRPRVLAAALEDAGAHLERVQRTLSDALGAGGWYAPETRPFLAHVTVARVGAGAGMTVRSAPLPAPPPIEFEASAVTLYRSRLGPAGARYEPLATAALGIAPRR